MNRSVVIKKRTLLNDLSDEIDCRDIQNIKFVDKTAAYQIIPAKSQAIIIQLVVPYSSSFGPVSAKALASATRDACMSKIASIEV